MKYINIFNLNQPLSQIVLGGPFGERSDKESFAILDRFIQMGGNAIETAHSYARGAAEKQIGVWIKKRKLREHIMLITKICHYTDISTSDFVNSVNSQLKISKERLGVKSIDILLLHRDPVNTPILEVLKLLEKHRLKGSIYAYGISNIKGSRLNEFDQAASLLSIPPLQLVSNYYGLAQQACSPWPGAYQLDLSGLKWLKKNKRPLLCWSALAQGWFANRRMSSYFQPVYETHINCTRKALAQELAQKKGVTALQIGLSYILSAPFSILASVGPHSIKELEEIIKGASLQLSKKDRRFLTSLA